MNGSSALPNNLEKETTMPMSQHLDQFSLEYWSKQIYPFPMYTIFR